MSCKSEPCRDKLSILLNCGGNMSIRFIEGGQINVKGSLAVQGFIMSANIICYDNITVAGTGVNMKEKGAIIDCEIYVKNTLHCPSIGNNKGTKTYIQFGYDKTRNKKIKDLEEALQKVQEAIVVLKSKYSVDITSPNVHMRLKAMTQTEKEIVIAGIQEKNKLVKQSEMLQKILNTELEARKENYNTSTVQIAQNVFPPITLECNNTKRVYDKDLPSSRFYYDADERQIDRSRMFGGKDDNRA